VFYDINGRSVSSFDYSSDENVREFSCCAFNPSGDVAAFGTYNRFYIYAFSPGRNAWEQVRACVGMLAVFCFVLGGMV
jgi:intraflagellar transport protein 172